MMKDLTLGRLSNFESGTVRDEGKESRNAERSGGLLLESVVHDMFETDFELEQFEPRGILRRRLVGRLYSGYRSRLGQCGTYFIAVASRLVAEGRWFLGSSAKKSVRYKCSEG